jgi:hypothetical protein
MVAPLCLRRRGFIYKCQRLDWTSSLGRLVTAYLKFLLHKRRIRFRNFKWESGTRIVNLPVPITFRSS